MRVVVIILLSLTAASFAEAAGRERLGQGYLVTNDTFGDFYDRWRTASVNYSVVWGSSWSGRPPEVFGDMVELRLMGQIISPANITAPFSSDRRYAAALSVGAHTHFTVKQWDISLGADLVVTGPSTGLGSLQSDFHRFLGETPPSQAVLDAQIEDAIYPTAVVEVAQTFLVSPSIAVRPFIEGRAGVETLARAGVDLELGRRAVGGWRVRDPVTGQRYELIRASSAGWRVLIGADIAHVFDSAYLPSGSGPDLREDRARVRIGFDRTGRNHNQAFFGLTWLGEEFIGQPEAQIVGSLQLSFRF
ncbi:MAG: lipid A-modifier LpxR family protein [Pseudomonadota bacterium]